MSYAPIGSELNLRNGDLTRDQATYGSRNDSTNSDHVSEKKKFSRNGKHSASSRSNFPIIVHCHLCWDWVWQRPQQFISRLSKRHKILFVETIGPDPQLAAPFVRFWSPEQFPNITILRLQFPAWRWNNGHYVDRERRRLVKEFIKDGPVASQFDNPVQWFYDPMAFTAFAGHMNEVLTVYDCMDELSKFRAAPPEIKEREALLLSEADVVFTGGRKLYENKSQQNANCHFYGCGVDISHFGKARNGATKVPDDIKSFPKPVLGYFGVVDERMDYELLEKLARENPNWSIVMVGPAIKVNESALPRLKNLHWLGQRAYADLPAYCKAFDACLMPFALNEATEFINPTKALEYMATGRPIVSSAVPDVVSNFGSVVRVAKTHNEFISLCRQAIQASDAARIEAGLKMAAENSWESIVAQLQGHMEHALTRKRNRVEVMA